MFPDIVVIKRTIETLSKTGLETEKTEIGIEKIVREISNKYR